MLQKISFALVNDRARYTHFIEQDGSIIALCPIEIIPEVRVGVVCPQDFPSDEQRLSIVHLAQLATGYDPTVSIEFGQGTSPFPPIVPSNHPLAEMAAQH
jgi:hypothetical protein